MAEFYQLKRWVTVADVRGPGSGRGRPCFFDDLPNFDFLRSELGVTRSWHHDDVPSHEDESPNFEDEIPSHKEVLPNLEEELPNLGNELPNPEEELPRRLGSSSSNFRGGSSRLDRSSSTLEGSASKFGGFKIGEKGKIGHGAAKARRAEERKRSSIDSDRGFDPFTGDLAHLEVGKRE